MAEDLNQAKAPPIDYRTPADDLAESKSNAIASLNYALMVPVTIGIFFFAFAALFAVMSLIAQREFDLVSSVVGVIFVVVSIGLCFGGARLISLLAKAS